MGNSRIFLDWLHTFRDNINNYKYYVDFEKVYRQAEEYKIELNILNSLIGSKNIAVEFKQLVQSYPNVLKCIPLLMAVRNNIVSVTENKIKKDFNFDKPNYSIDEYVDFMDKSGLFELISNRIINNLYDYVLGIEVGLDSNGRKNRGGTLMENLVEEYLKLAGFKKGESYFSQLQASVIESKWGYDLSSISNDGKAEKRFDFVVKTDKNVYAIETNFYTGGGSKLNETARSYKTIALESKNIDNFEFVWVTDGAGWWSARSNLEETFDVLESMYNIYDLEQGVFNKIFK